MLKFFCDRCGAEMKIEGFMFFKDEHDNSSLTCGTEGMVSFPKKDKNGCMKMESHLLCKKCMSELYDFFKIGRESK